MDQRTRDYLIRSQSKVIAHYQQILQTSSLPQVERETIHQRMARVESDLEMFRRRGASNPMPLLKTA